MSDQRWQFISDKIRAADSSLSVSQRICLVAKDVLNAKSVSLAVVIDRAYRPMAASDDLAILLDNERFTLSLLQVDPHMDLQIVIRRIHLAVESRNTLEQAQGMIAQRFEIDSEDALIRLRDVSDRTNLTLGEVATAVVQRDQTSPVIPLLANG